MSWGKKGSKYGAKRCWVTPSGQLVEHAATIHDLRERRSEGWILFSSKKEAARFIALKCMLSVKEINNLGVQPKFELFGKNGSKIGTYTPDFYYECRGEKIIEEIKGNSRTAASRDYVLRKKLFLDNYPQYKFIES